jgi:hypothetical protein
MKTIIRAQSAAWRNAVEIYVGSADFKTHVKEIVTEPVSENACVEPTLTISRDNAQTLMDDLWQAGFRPTEGTGSAGSLAATERHHADMRRIALAHPGLKLSEA